MKLTAILAAIVLLGGCGGNQAAKPEASSDKTATAETAPKAGEEIPADPYAEMEAERNAVKESLAGKVSEVPDTGENAQRKVYSGIVEIAGKGSAQQTIILKSNRGSFVLVGGKSAELLAEEGKFITVMGKPAKGNPTVPDCRDLPQLEVDGIVRQKLGK